MKIFRTALLVAFSAVALAGCGADEAPSEAPSEADSVTISDGWIKSVDTGMTAGFAEIRNDGAEQVRVVSASTPVAPMMELHEVVPSADGSMKMQPKEGGFTVAAYDTTVLAPGGDHLMLMNVTDPLTPGTDTEITLTFEDGSSTTFTAQVRDFAGAQENYSG